MTILVSEVGCHNNNIGVRWDVMVAILVSEVGCHDYNIGVRGGMS